MVRPTDASFQIPGLVESGDAIHSHSSLMSCVISISSAGNCIGSHRCDSSSHGWLRACSPAVMGRQTNGRRLPRSLAEIDAMHNYQSDTIGAQLNPDLACQGCPPTDTREQVQDTTTAPWDAIGMLARAEQAISRWASLKFVHLVTASITCVHPFRSCKADFIIWYCPRSSSLVMSGGVSFECTGSRKLAWCCIK